MLLKLEELVKKYNITCTGILHVGAHNCEELPEYETMVPRHQILWVEALPDKVAMCQQRYPGIVIEQAVVSDKVETVMFHRSNNAASSSMLELELHKQYHPEVRYVDAYPVNTTTLNDILQCHPDVVYNCLFLDIQGAELKALHGMESYLSNIDHIYTEVNTDYVYKNCALLGEIDEYLGRFGFTRMEIHMTPCHWGDAFYTKLREPIVPLGSLLLR